MTSSMKERAREAWRWAFAIAAIVALLLALDATAATSKPLRLCDVCEGFTISKRGDDLLIRCPGKPEPWMTIKDCKSPRVTRSGNNITINCTFG